MDNSNQKVLRQLEYYFSDSNLPKDRFLRKEMAKNEDQYVDVDVLLAFNKMKSLGATKEQVNAVVKNSALLSCDPDGEKIKRVTPLPKVSQFPNRAVFVMGWPSRTADPDAKDPTIEEVTELFAPCGTVLDVNLRRDSQRRFRGCMFIEMESPEAAERVVADEFEITVKDKKLKLVTETFADYHTKIKKDPMSFGKDNFDVEEAKQKGRQERYEKRKRHRERDGERGEGKSEGDTEGVKTEDREANGDNEDGGENGNKRIKVEHTTEEGSTGSTKPNDNEGSNEDGEHKVKKEDESAERPFTWDKGVIACFKDIANGACREDLQEALENYGEPRFVDFRRDATVAHIRFGSPEETKSIVEKFIEDKATICGEVPTVSVIEGEEEATYWGEVERKFRERNKNRNNGRQGGRGRGRGRGRPRGRGRGGFRKRDR